MDTKILLPLTTRISHLKTMKIFAGGYEACPPDKFTLACKGKELSDDVSLASLYTPGKPLSLKINTVTFTVKDKKNRWPPFPLTMNADDIEKKDGEIIKGHLYSHKGINPNDCKVYYPAFDFLPESTYCVDYSM